MVQLTAELERATECRLKIEKNLIQTKQSLERVSGQRNCLMKTTELYEADKRALEHEVGGKCGTLSRKFLFNSYLHYSPHHPRPFCYFSLSFPLLSSPFLTPPSSIPSHPPLPSYPSTFSSFLYPFYPSSLHFLSSLIFFNELDIASNKEGQ